MPPSFLPPSISNCADLLQPSIFEAVGQRPLDDNSVAILKSGTGWEVTYKPTVGDRMVRADCPGPMSYSVSPYPWQRIRRPIFPLDPEMEWEPPGVVSSTICVSKL